MVVIRGGEALRENTEVILGDNGSLKAIFRALVNSDIFVPSHSSIYATRATYFCRCATLLYRHEAIKHCSHVKHPKNMFVIPPNMMIV